MSIKMVKITKVILRNHWKQVSEVEKYMQIGVLKYLPGKIINRRETGIYLPTIISSMSEAFLRIRLQISMVKIVEDELKMEVREDMRAAIMTASMTPRAPVGISLSTSVG